jgi:hypothetical protein
VDAQIATVDITGLIQDRLNALRDAHVTAAEVIREVTGEAAADDGGGVTTVPGEIVVDHEQHGDSDDDAGGGAA